MTLLRWVVPLMSLLLVACGVAPEPPLRIGTNVWLGYEPLYVARHAGTLPGGVKLVEYPTTAEVIRAFRNRTLEAAAVTLDEAISMAEDDGELRIALLLDQSYGADALVAAPAIPNLRALRGKEVGADSLTLGAYILGRALRHAGMSPADVRIRQLSIEHHEAAFAQGLVDAVVSFEPIVSRLVRQGGRVLFDGRAIPGEIVDVLVYRQSLEQRDAPRLKAVAQGWFTAVEQIERRDPSTLATVARRQKLTQSELSVALGGLHFSTPDENRAALATDHSAFQLTLTRMHAQMRSLGLASGTINPAGLISPHLTGAL